MNNRGFLFKKWRQVKLDVKELIDQFPENKREAVLFDQWSLKDIVSHLNHWMADDLHALINLKQGKKSFWEPDIDSFNAAGVDQRKNIAWQTVYEEFITLATALEQAYESLPEDLWTAEMWENHAGNPLRSLQVDLKHWKNEHINQLTKKLNELKLEHNN